LEQRDAYVRAYVSPHACAVMPWGGGYCMNSSLAWDGAVMMPLQKMHQINSRKQTSANLQAMGGVHGGGENTGISYNTSQRQKKL
jgi:hypothetical protein